MSAPDQSSPASRNVSWSQNFWSRVHRYRVMLGKYWWVLALTVSLAVCAAAWYLANKQPTYFSTAKLNAIIEGTGIQLQGANNAISQQIDEFWNSQREIINGADVARQTADGLQARYPEMPAGSAHLDLLPHSSVMTFSASGNNPLYTQRWLQATIDSYLAKSKQMRTEVTNQQLEKLRAQISDAQAAINADDAVMIKFQRDHNVVFDKQGATPAEKNLADIRDKLTKLRDEADEYARMQASPDQGLDRAAAPRAQSGGGNNSEQQRSSGASSAGSEYTDARQKLAEIQFNYDNLSRDMRPEHPKLLALEAQIRGQQKQIQSLQEQYAGRIAGARTLALASIKAFEDQQKAAEQVVREESLLKVEFSKLADQKTRDESNYNNLQNALVATVNAKAVGTATVGVVDPPSAPVMIPVATPRVLAMAVLLGIAAGIGILLLIERMDDRIGSVSEFQAIFSEHIVGQIPRDGSQDTTELLTPDDERHQLVESFRNLRSTLLYMPMEGHAPKTLLITSAIPNEGKSTVSTNLALVMAFAGKKTLLIDCDLRRGAIHKAFDLKRSPGLTDVLGHNVNWKLAIKESGVENLHILPRGRNVPQPGEYLLRSSCDVLFRELYPLYDYIIIDSSPVLAADDTASLAPKLDATLFVARLSFTSAKETRKALEILYKRQANIPGLILNQLDTSSPEFVYYQYSEYYHANTADDGEDDEPGAKKAPQRKPAAPSESVKLG